MSVSPGPWLRLTALAASGATLLAVVSGVAGLDAEHRILAALAMPPLVALAVAAWLAHRRLLPSAVVALVLFGAAAVLTSPVIHVAAAAASFAATVVATTATFRGAPGSNGWPFVKRLNRPWRRIAWLRLSIPRCVASPPASVTARVEAVVSSVPGQAFQL